MLFDLNRFGAGTYKQEAAKIVHLAWPMFIAQIAQVGVGVVDTVMAGRYGAEDLAAVALGTSLFMTLYISLMGVVTALNPILSQLYGAQKISDLSKVASQGVWLAFILGIVGMLIMWALIAPLNHYFKLGDYVKHVFAYYMFWIAMALPFALVYRSLHAYASSLNRPKPMMWISLFGLCMSIPINYVLIYGLWGIPGLGGIGCAIGTVLVFAINTVCLWLYIRYDGYFKQFGQLSLASGLDFSILKRIVVLGIPIGLSFLIEVSLFTFISILIANLGVEYVASQQVVINISSLVYMVPQSLGAALSVCGLCCWQWPNAAGTLYCRCGFDHRFGGLLCDRFGDIDFPHAHCFSVHDRCSSHHHRGNALGIQCGLSIARCDANHCHRCA